MPEEIPVQENLFPEDPVTPEEDDSVELSGAEARQRGKERAEAEARRKELIAKSYEPRSSSYHEDTGQISPDRVEEIRGGHSIDQTEEARKIADEARRKIAEEGE